jgi:hypothetical protein
VTDRQFDPQTHDEAQAPNRVPYLHTQEGGRGSGALNSARKRVGFLKRFGRRAGYIHFIIDQTLQMIEDQKKEIFLKILDLEFIMFIQFVKRLPFDWQC